jgi:sarcosine dehydrogenase
MLFYLTRDVASAAFAGDGSGFNFGSYAGATSHTLLQQQQQPSEAECVIIGGGSIGCSIFYHLTKNGMKNCVLLERDKLTSGTTWHTAGLLWNLRPNDQDVPLLKYTRKLISEILPQETGDDAGWINNGGLFIATTKERMDEYKRLHTLGKCHDVESHLLTPQQTRELYPLLNVDDIYGSLFSPSDGLIDPTQWTSALTKMGKQRGGKVLEGTPVLNIETEKCAETGYTQLEYNRCHHRVFYCLSYAYSRITGVQTPNGVIKTPLVVNASGAWGPKVAEMVGLYAPTMAYRHAYAVTDAIDGMRDMPNVRDHDGSFYFRLQVCITVINVIELIVKIQLNLKKY